MADNTGAGGVHNAPGAPADTQTGAPVEKQGDVQGAQPAAQAQAEEKLVIWFRPVGGAPILRQSRFRLPLSRPWHTVQTFLRSQLYPEGAARGAFQAGCATQGHSDAPLHLYVNSAFLPAPDEPVANLHRCFSVDSVLVVNYSVTPAWG